MRFAPEAALNVLGTTGGITRVYLEAGEAEARLLWPRAGRRTPQDDKSNQKDKKNDLFGFLLTVNIHISIQSSTIPSKNQHC